MTFAELLQAETEEQALGAGGAGTVGTGKTSVPFVKVAALGTSTTATQESKNVGFEG